MKQIPQQVKTDYDVILKDKVVPENAHVHYRKWLRYYLDFCEKYHLKQLERGNLALFIEKLREKKQAPQQQKQANHAILLFYELMGYIKPHKSESLKNKHDKLPEKKDELSQPKRTNASWVPIYDGLKAEIKMRHYSPKTLKSYRSWVRHFQNFAKSKDPKLLSTADVKAFLTFLAVKRNVLFPLWEFSFAPDSVSKDADYLGGNGQLYRILETGKTEKISERAYGVFIWEKKRKLLKPIP